MNQNMVCTTVLHSLFANFTFSIYLIVILINETLSDLVKLITIFILLIEFYFIIGSFWPMIYWTEYLYTFNHSLPKFQIWFRSKFLIAKFKLLTYYELFNTENQFQFRAGKYASTIIIFFGTWFIKNWIQQY